MDDRKRKDNARLLNPKREEMTPVVTSSITGLSYDPSKCVRILNLKQSAFYYSQNVTLYDLYVSSDYKTGQPVWVFIYNRNESWEAYDKWCRHDTQ